MNFNLQPSIIFYPLSLIYCFVINLRNFLYDHKILKSNQAALPTICVGNVIVGGSGKSPFVQYLAENLMQLNFLPVILLRGYKGSIQGPHQVSENDSITEVGDEALMHFRKFGNKVKIIIAKDRVLGSKFIADNNLGNIIILDDGLQHRRLRCSKNILLLDVSDGRSIKKWNNNLLLPAGYLREQLSSVLKRTDFVVYVNKSNSEIKNFELANLKIPTYQFAIKNYSITTLLDNKKMEPENIKNKKLLAVTSIANPKSFFTSTESLGLTIEKTLSFPDHYLFTEKDFADFKAQNLEIICTEKDAVKLRNFAAKDDNLIYTLSINGIIVDKESRFFKELI